MGVAPDQSASIKHVLHFAYHMRGQRGITRVQGRASQAHNQGHLKGPPPAPCSPSAVVGEKMEDTASPYHSQVEDSKGARLQSAHMSLPLSIPASQPCPTPIGPQEGSRHWQGRGCAGLTLAAPLSPRRGVRAGQHQGPGDGPGLGREEGVLNPEDEAA